MKNEIIRLEIKLKTAKTEEEAKNICMEILKFRDTHLAIARFVPSPELVLAAYTLHYGTTYIPVDNFEV